MQGELFKVSGPVVDASKLPPPQASWLDRFRVTLRLDHLAVAAILALVLYVLVFSFGVEKGKRFALDELKAEKVKQEQMTKEGSERQAVTPEPATPKASETESEVPQAAPPAGENPSPAETSETLGKYTIQLITFTSRSRADQEVERLKKLGHESFVIPAGKFYQVCVDAFQNMGEAKDRLTQFKAEGFASSDAFIRSLKGQIA